MFDVEEIQFKFADGIVDGGNVSVLDLCPPCDAWPHLVSLGKKGYFLFQEIAEIRLFRARSHQTHIAAQYIQKLRKLIEPILANHASYASDSSVGVCRPTRSPSLGVLTHRAELQDLKRFATQADSGLPEENGKSSFNCDRRGNDHHQRHRKQQKKRRKQ